MHSAEYPYIFRENMKIYLQALNDEIRRIYGNVRVDLLVAGGSSIILKHNFRKETEDIDAYIRSSANINIGALIENIMRMYSITND